MLVIGCTIAFPAPLNDGWILTGCPNLVNADPRLAFPEGPLECAMLVIGCTIAIPPSPERMQVSGQCEDRADRGD